MWNCRRCGKVITNIDSGRIHRLIHKNNRIYRCEICLEFIFDKKEFKKHIKNHKFDLLLKKYIMTF